MSRSDNLPIMSGTYVLVIRVDEPLLITPGRLGLVRLEAACYLYVGSARGPGGLRARVGRHLRSGKRPHWHVDALTAAAPVIAVWWRESPERLECVWAQALLAADGIEVAAAGFGSSDCHCPAHLFRLNADRLAAARRACGDPHEATLR